VTHGDCALFVRPTPQRPSTCQVGSSPGWGSFPPSQSSWPLNWTAFRSEIPSVDIFVAIFIPWFYAGLRKSIDAHTSPRSGALAPRVDVMSTTAVPPTTDLYYYSLSVKIIYFVKYFDIYILICIKNFLKYLLIVWNNVPKYSRNIWFNTLVLVFLAVMWPQLLFQKLSSFVAFSLPDCGKVLNPEILGSSVRNVFEHGPRQQRRPDSRWRMVITKSLTPTFFKK